MNEPIKSEIISQFRALVGLETTDERTLESKLIVGKAEFSRLGLADVGLLETCSDDITLLTDDLGLYLAALDRGHSAVNFTHVREAEGLL